MSTNIHAKALSKTVIFNLSQNAQPIGDVLDTPLKVVGLHHKTVTTGEGEEKLLTIIFVDAGEDVGYVAYFSSARSFYNGMEDVAQVFGDDIAKGGVTLTVKSVQTRNNNSVYTISL